MSRRRIRRRRRRINSCPFISSTVRITCGQWPLGRVRPHSTIPSPGRGWRPAAPSYWPLGYRLAESSCGTVAQVCHLYWLFIVARGWINVRGFLGPPLLMNFHLQDLNWYFMCKNQTRYLHYIPMNQWKFLSSMNIEQEWKWFHSIHSVGTWSHLYRLSTGFSTHTDMCNQTS